MKKLNPFFYQLIIGLKIGFRNKNLLFINYLLPLFFYVIMGLMMTKINKTFVNYMTTSMIMFSIMTSTLLTVPNEIVFSRTEGVFRSYKIYGIGKIQVLSYYTIISFINCLFTGLIIFFTATPLFGAAKVENVFMMIIGIFLFFLVNMGICFILSMVINIPKAAGLIAQTVFIPTIIIGGIMIPFDVMPKELLPACKILPSSYVINMLNVLAIDKKNNFTSAGNSILNISGQQSLFILIALCIVTYILSFTFFKFNNK